MHNIRKFLNIYIFVFVLQISLVFHKDTLPSFRVIAPQYLCKLEGNNAKINKSTEVTVEFQPKEGVNFSYRFRIDFKLIPANNLSQREMLLIWKEIRMLENILNGPRRSSISQNNLAIINESELIPGIIYMFHVTGENDAGEVSREHSFHIQYYDLMEHSDISAHSANGINLLIIGSEEVVSNMDYNVVAKVSFCSRKHVYHIEWTLKDLAQKFHRLQNNIGSCLRIPKNALNPESRSHIVAKVVETETGRTLTIGDIIVEVFSKGFEAMIVPSAAKVGVGSKVTLRLFIRNYDHIKQISIQWKCIDQISKKVLMSCHLYNNMSYIYVELSKEGSYQVLAYVTINEILSKVNADIEVVSFAFISFDFHDVPNLIPPSHEHFQFSVMVLNLIPNCEAIWLSAQEDGFKFIEPGILNKDHYGYIKIPDLEKNYLEQIADFVNHTINKEITLTIPAAESKLNVDQSMWHGFEENALYKFRLAITCPTSYVESKFPNLQAAEIGHQTATSYFSFDIHTNSPPKVEYLIVQPIAGNALKSVFHVYSASGKDLLLDSPISYELTLIVDEFHIQFDKYYEYKNWDIRLPFSRNLLTLQVTVCDVRLSCRTIENNTDLNITYEEFSDNEFRSHLHDIRGALRRTDFDEAFNLLLMTTITLKAANSPRWDQWLSVIRIVISEELGKLANYTRNAIYIPPKLILKFIKQTKDLLEYLQVINYEDLHYLLKIIENLIDIEELNPNDISITMVNKLRVHEIFQNQRSFSTINHETTYANTYLSVLEGLLKHEQINQIEFTTKVIKMLRKFCLIPAIRHFTLNTSTVSIRFIKRKGDFLKHYSELKHVIPGKLQLKLNLRFLRKANLIAADKFYCIYAIYYNFMLYSLKESPLLYYGIYEVVYNDKQILEMRFPSNHNYENNFKTEWFLNAIRPDEDSSLNTCLLSKTLSNYTTDKWTSDYCSFNKYLKLLKCHCSQDGFLKIGYGRAEITINQTSTDNTQLDASSASAPNKSKISINNNNTIPNLKDELNSTNIIKRAHGKIITNSDIFLVYTTLIIMGILIIVLIVVYILYYSYRRRFGKVLDRPSDLQLESRQAFMGIHYASVTDEHLLNGKL